MQKLIGTGKVAKCYPGIVDVKLQKLPRLSSREAFNTIRVETLAQQAQYTTCQEQSQDIDS